MIDLQQRVIRHLLTPIDLWRTGDGSQLRYLREFERTQFLPRAEVLELQRARLGRLLAHAYEDCPYYREQFEAAGLVPGDIRQLRDLAALPILEKRHIQQHRDAMVDEHWPRSDLIPNQTGGSTGQPVSFFLSHERKWSRSAATVRHNRWAGYDIGDKVGYIWGAAQDIPRRRWWHDLRNVLMDRQLFLDTGHFTEEKLLAFHGALKRFRPGVLVAYARGAVLLARYLRARGLDAYQPRAIITTAEVLEAEDRALLESTFGCPVFNRYGCREVSVVASECDRHRGLHTMAEGLLIEVVRPDGTAAEAGEEGSILVTDLLNLAMPLIRYRIGDLGAFEPGDCPCGRGLPRLRGVTGRVTDFLVGSDGSLVSGVFLATYVVAQRPSLGQVQILQDRPGAVLYRIQRGPDFRDPEDLDYLAQSSRKYLGAATRVEWEFVAELAREPSGKYLFSRSTVAPEYLRSARAT